MYSVCYQHHLKPGKTLQDFRKWHHQYWHMQKSWGAVRMKMYQDCNNNQNVVHCEYFVKNIRNWTKHAIDAGAEKWLQDLQAIADIQSITIIPGKGPGPASNRQNTQRLN